MPTRRPKKTSPKKTKRSGQSGRPTPLRRQNEMPERNEEERQRSGDRFPRESFE